MRGNTTEEMDTLGAENIKSKNSQTQNIHNFSLQKKLRGKNGEERGKGVRMPASRVWACKTQNHLHFTNCGANGICRGNMNNGY